LAPTFSTEVLAQAVRAVYPEEMIHPVPQDMQMRYLMRSRTAAGRAEVRIVSELRRVCRFVRLNLMDERPCRGGAPRLPLHARI
jgi:chemotaxis protein methyltransferase CheR